MSNPFEYVKGINGNIDMTVDDDYNQFIINKNFSMFPDTVLFANEMNTKQVSNQMHYDYLVNSIRPRKRFKKWPKSAKTDDSLAWAIAEKYKYSYAKAVETLSILCEDDKEKLKKQLLELDNI